MVDKQNEGVEWASFIDFKERDHLCKRAMVETEAKDGGVVVGGIILS